VADKAPDQQSEPPNSGPLRGPDSGIDQRLSATERAGSVEPRHDDPASASTMSADLHQPARSVNGPEAANDALLLLGRRIREARLLQGFSQTELAGRLRLGIAQLDALEHGDRRRLPEGVFVIAQARRVADSLGINVEPELAALRSSPPLQKPRSATLVPLDQGVRRPSPIRAPALFPAVLGILGILGVAAAVLLVRPWLQRSPSSAIVASPGALPQSASRPAGSSAASPPASPTNATKPASGSPPPPAAPSTVPADALELSSRPGSWISIRDRDGRSLFEGQLDGSRRFPLAQGLQVLAGRPDLVRVSRAGSAAAPLGAISDVRWHRFEPTVPPSGPAARPPSR